MPHVRLDEDAQNLVAGHYSQARGPVLRSDQIELTKVHFKQGEGAQPHQHPEEQVVYVLSGAVRMTVDGETYVVRAGEASYHPSNAMHAAEALEDTVSLSFKNLVDPSYEQTGRL